MTDIYDFTTLQDPKAQMLALAQALRQQRAQQQTQQAELESDYASQQGKAAEYRGLGLLTSLGANPLLQGIQRASTAAGDDYQQDARSTLGLLRGAKADSMSAPLRLLGLQQGAAKEARLAEDADTREGRLAGQLEWQKSKAARAATLAAEKAAKKAEADEEKKTQGKFKLEGSLRDKFQALPAYKNFEIAAVALDQITSAFKDPSAQGDLAGITAFMKSIDPTTGVKDQEFNNASNAAGMLGKAEAMLAKVKSGERLTPEQREGFLKVARSNVAALKRPHDAALKYYQGLASDYEVNPSRVARPASDINLEDPVPPAPRSAAPPKRAAPAESVRESIDLPDGSRLITYSDGRTAIRKPKKAE